MKLVECVPNFSEGKRKEIVDEIVNAISYRQEIMVLDIEMDPNHNRSVITFVSPIEFAVEAAFRGIKKASELIDMDQHKGEHPRFGAADVVPFVPLFDTTMEECVELANRLGERVGNELKIPVYLYEHAAKIPERKELPNIRNENFQYEQLKEHIKEEKWKPDYGPQEIGKAGATIIGAREFLIAFNVNLNTNDLDVAKKIARSVREKSGGLKNVRALGFQLKDKNQVQVSMNLINYKQTGMYKAFELVRLEAERRGVLISNSEIVGMIPLDSLRRTVNFYLRLNNFKNDQILEYKLLRKGNLVNDKGINQFLDELSSPSPAPGGGAASALVGAVAASLSSMVANLTIGKKKYAEYEEEMKNIVKQANELKNRLLKLMEEDEKAFNEIMDALKLPKNTPEEERIRKERIQESTKRASIVPITTAKLCLDVMRLSRVVTEKGNRNAITDGVCSAYFAYSAMKGAIMNVLINLKNIEDKNFVDNMKNEINILLKEGDEILKYVENKSLEVIS
ncbi:MAG: glutamate formimidoyltransferase [Thermoplasmata archaeon]